MSDDNHNEQVIARLDILDKKFDALINALKNTNATTAKPRAALDSPVKPKRHDTISNQGLPATPIAPKEARPVKNDRRDYAMVYKDSGGNLSERAINVRKVHAKNGKLYVSAYCFKRMRIKDFVASSIVSLHDIERDKTFVDTDEVYATLGEWMVE